MTAIRVLVADDQPVLRAAIVDLLSADPRIDVIGTAGDTQEAIAQCAALAPDVVLMDEFRRWGDRARSGPSRPDRNGGPLRPSRRRL